MFVLFQAEAMKVFGLGSEILVSPTFIWVHPIKVETFDEYTDVYQINPEHVLYMGDEIPDYHVMKLVGLPTCPQDASPEIKAISKYISHKNGGKGAAREVIEQVMKAQGKWKKHFDGKHD